MTKMKVGLADMTQKNSQKNTQHIRKNMSRSESHLNTLYLKPVTHQDLEEMLSLTQSIAPMFMT